MPELVPPDPRCHRSFLEAVAEFRDAGASDSEAGLWIMPRPEGGPREARTAEELADPAAFVEFTERLRAMGDLGTTLPPDLVHSTNRWWLEGDTFLGRLSIRHRLTRWLRDYGGHIGYVVRPSARRRGHATAMLRASLPYARELGIENALVTCDDTNLASRKVIEAVGGVYEDQRGEKLRFWVRTA